MLFLVGAFCCVTSAVYFALLGLSKVERAYARRRALDNLYSQIYNISK